VEQQCTIANHDGKGVQSRTRLLRPSLGQLGPTHLLYCCPHIAASCCDVVGSCGAVDAQGPLQHPGAQVEVRAEVKVKVK